MWNEDRWSTTSRELNAPSSHNEEPDPGTEILSCGRSANRCGADFDAEQYWPKCSKAVAHGADRGLRARAKNVYWLAANGVDPTFTSRTARRVDPVAAAPAPKSRGVVRDPELHGYWRGPARLAARAQRGLRLAPTTLSSISSRHGGGRHYLPCWQRYLRVSVAAPARSIHCHLRFVHIALYDRCHAELELAAHAAGAGGDSISPHDYPGLQPGNAKPRRCRPTS